MGSGLHHGLGAEQTHSEPKVGHEIIIAEERILRNKSDYFDVDVGSAEVRYRPLLASSFFFQCPKSPGCAPLLGVMRDIHPITSQCVSRRHVYVRERPKTKQNPARRTSIACGDNPAEVQQGDVGWGRCEGNKRGLYKNPCLGRGNGNDVIPF